MACGKHRFSVGANLVRHFASSPKRAIATDDHQINLAALHKMAGGVVGDDLVRNPLLRQFPRGQRGALETGRVSSQKT